MMGYFINLLAFFSALSLLGGCSAADVDSNTIIKKGKDSQTVADGQDTSLAIEANEMAGTQVDIPAGALQVGTEVELKPLAEPPDSFKETGYTASGRPISITAVGPDGQPVTETTKPMSIQLPVNAAALTAVESTEQNLCVFLSWAEDESLFVWRRKALDYAEQKITFYSKKLGIFQIVYCGEEALADFKDAQTENIAGEKSDPLVKVAIPSSGTFNLNFGHSHICAGVMKVADNQATVYSINDWPHEPGAALDLIIYKSGLQDLSSVADTDLLTVFIHFQTAEQTCGLDQVLPTKDLHVANGVFHFYKNAGAIKPATLSGTLGDTSGPFGLETFAVRLGRSDGGAQAAAPDADVCFGSEVAGDGGGAVQVSSSLASTGKISGQTSGSLYRVYQPSTSATKTMYATLFQKHCRPKPSDSGLDSGTSQPYSVFFHGLSQSPLYLTPVDAQISLLPNAPKVCVQVFPKGSNTAALSEGDREKILLAQILVKQSQTSPYKLLVPFRDGGVYEIGYEIYISDQDTCASAATTYLPTLDKSLNSSITISYP